MWRLVWLLLTALLLTAAIVEDEDVGRLGDGQIVRKLKDRFHKPEPNQPPHVPFLKPPESPEQFAVEVGQGVTVALAASSLLSIIRYLIKPR